MPRHDDEPESATGWQVDPARGLLAGARQVSSPHHGERPAGSRIELVVIHGISLPPDRFGGPWIDDLFCGRLDPDAHPYFATLRGLRVSAHLLVRRDGSVTQYVPFHRRAWHAGVSSWQGRTECNDFSIGIEVEGSPYVPYEDAQYRTLAAVLRALAAAYPDLALPDCVTGHAEIAPARKADPWESFDWEELKNLLNAERPDRGPGLRNHS